jgi:hypothetical protein
MPPEQGFSASLTSLRFSLVLKSESSLSFSSPNPAHRARLVGLGVDADDDGLRVFPLGDAVDVHEEQREAREHHRMQQHLLAHVKRQVISPPTVDCGSS